MNSKSLSTSDRKRLKRLQRHPFYTEMQERRHAERMALEDLLTKKNAALKVLSTREGLTKALKALDEAEKAAAS